MPSCTNRKKTLGEVSEYLASQGYELLSTKYSSNSAKLDIRCPAGHQYRASWNTFQKGSRCPECRGNARVQFKDIKEIARFRRYSLISTSYQNKTPIIFRCSQGHMVSQSYRGFREYGCYYCKRKPLIDQDHVIQTIQKSGYKVEIVGPLTAMGKVLEITCSSGHTYIGSWNAFKAGKRCGKCRGRNKSRTELESMASSSGLILMDSTGNRHDSKQLVQCAAKNHVYWTRTYSLAAGCKFCTKGVTTVNDLIQIAAERGDRIDLEATTIAVPAPQRAEINIDLPCGHRIRKQIRGYLKYTNCRQCNVSSGEWELNSRLSKWNPTKIRLNNKELDLYIPELNLAIEYCGLYWHSDKFLEPSYHQDKLKTCHKNGISLLTIFEDEWKKDPDKWVMVETYSEGGGIIQYTKYEDRVDLGVYGIITGNRLDIGGTIPTPNQLRGLCDRLGIGELIIAGEYGLILDGFEIQCLGPTPRSQPNIGYKVYSCGDIRHIRKEIL